MNHEENVYEETTLTENVQTKHIGAEKRKMPPKKDSTVLGKFKDVDALAQAYSALQAEFTRRSQRLKELEKMTENFGGKKASAECAGVEKLRKNATAKRAEAKRFDAFVAEVLADKNAAKPVAFDAEHGVEALGDEKTIDVIVDTAANVAVDTVSDKILDMASNMHSDTAQNGQQENVGEPSVGKQNVGEPNGFSENVQEQKTTEKQTSSVQFVGLKNGEADAEMRESAKGPVAAYDGAALSSETLYEKVLGDENVRLRIIGEYLASIGKSGAPITFGNAGICATPPAKAKSIADAGGMALQYFKTKMDVK